MDIKRCERGHFYDAETNICCPQCAVEQGAAFGEQDDFGPTMPGGEMGETGGFGSVMPGSGADEMEDFGPTMPGGGMGGFGSAMPGSGMGETGDFGPTMPGSGMGGMEDYGSTMPGGAAENGASSAVEDYDGVTEAVDMGGVVGFSPTVGWLVCVEGPARGTDTVSGQAIISSAERSIWISACAATGKSAVRSMRCWRMIRRSGYFSSVRRMEGALSA